jgi:hypothetical protein
MKHIYILLIIFLSQLGCTPNQNIDEPFLIQKHDNVTNKLKLNGYYYTKDSGQVKSFCTLILLYANGVISYRGTTEFLGFDSLDRLISLHTNTIKSQKRNWGLYEINANSIAYEQLATQATKYYRFHSDGQILSDTSFVITQTFGSNNKIQPLNETYHFRQFSPKPDSTNNFIP